MNLCLIAYAPSLSTEKLPEPVVVATIAVNEITAGFNAEKALRTLAAQLGLFDFAVEREEDLDQGAVQLQLPLPSAPRSPIRPAAPITRVRRRRLNPV
jgi:hypothetical protein